MSVLSRTETVFRPNLASKTCVTLNWIYIYFHKTTLSSQWIFHSVMWQMQCNLAIFAQFIMHTNLSAVAALSCDYRVFCQYLLPANNPIRVRQNRVWYGFWYVNLTTLHRCICRVICGFRDLEPGINWCALLANIKKKTFQYNNLSPPRMF